MRLTIHLRPDGVIVAQARADGPPGVVGDTLLEVAPGQMVAGVPYEVWHSHHGKTVDIRDLRQDVDAFAHG